MLPSGCEECTDTLPRQQHRGGPGEGGRIFVAWGHRLSVKLKVENGKRERRGDPCGRPGARRTDCHSQCSRWSRNDGLFARDTVKRRDTWVPPYNSVFCRAGPACPAVGAPVIGRGRTPPLRMAGGCGGACSYGVDRVPVGGNDETSAAVMRLGSSI